MLVQSTEEVQENPDLLRGMLAGTDFNQLYNSIRTREDFTMILAVPEIDLRSTD